MEKFIQLTKLNGTIPEGFSTGKKICIPISRISYFESANYLEYEQIKLIKDDTIRKSALSNGFVGTHIVLIDTEHSKPKEFYVVETPDECLAKM